MHLCWSEGASYAPVDQNITCQPKPGLDVVKTTKCSSQDTDTVTSIRNHYFLTFVALKYLSEPFNCFSLRSLSGRIRTTVARTILRNTDARSNIGLSFWNGSLKISWDCRNFTVYGVRQDKWSKSANVFGVLAPSKQKLPGKSTRSSYQPAFKAQSARAICWETHRIGGLE